MKKSIILSALCMLLLAGCKTVYAPVPSQPAAPQTYTINLALTKEPQYNKYAKLDYGVRLNVTDHRSSKNILKKHDGYVTSSPRVEVSPDVFSFTEDNMKRYMRTMGFQMNADIATDYMMQVSIDEYHVSYLSGIGWSGVVKLAVEVYDSQRQLVYPHTLVKGTATNAGSGSNWTLATQTINQAFLNAMEDVDWDRIAYFLRRADSPAQEGNKAVSGQGNTALENTIIRWYIESTPRGADVTWRVVSSTPDVKNTNFNYVGSTPYESTESFDIKGLTYNNSGDVQIEISCEKAGYVTQRKRFNLRQVIDQKEISTKFNLIKED